MSKTTTDFFEFQTLKTQKKIFFHLPKLCFACAETEIFRTRYLVSIKKTSSGKETASNFKKKFNIKKPTIKKPTVKKPTIKKLPKTINFEKCMLRD